MVDLAIRAVINLFSFSRMQEIVLRKRDKKREEEGRDFQFSLPNTLNGLFCTSFSYSHRSYLDRLYYIHRMIQKYRNWRFLK